MLMILVAGCQNEYFEEPIPLVPVNFQINVNNPVYLDLHTRGWMYLNDEGVRGVIVYKRSQFEYEVMDRNCSFQPNSACATVDVHPSNLYLIDTCCGSTFDFDGNPTSGPAYIPLRGYSTRMDGNFLVVTNEAF